MKLVDKYANIKTEFVLLLCDNTFWISHARTPYVCHDIYCCSKAEGTRYFDAGLDYRFENLYSGVKIFELTEDEIMEHLILETI